VITGQPDAEPGGPDTSVAAPDGLARARRAAPRRPLVRLRWALLTALVSGFLLAAAFAPLGVWPLAVVSPALLVVALSGRSLRAAFTVGLAFGLTFFLPLLAWVINLAWFAWIALAIA
jgi:apolipoprotein N-acyltransferase